MTINNANNNKFVLNVIGVPIGNIDDLSPRAYNTLKNSNIILCEDTRMAKKLLMLVKIDITQIKFIKYDNFNEKEISPKIIDLIRDENNVVSLISDAGMPCISDPGFSIISKCKQYDDIFINVISGPSAFLHALIKSNHNSKFTFLGFIPDKKIKRQNYLSSLTSFTYICYVSPHKLISVLEDFDKIFSSDITLYLIKEMTKIFETSWEGTPKELLEKFLEYETIKGEYTLVFTINPKKEIKKINKYSSFSKVDK